MQLILRGKRLGFSLADIKEYLDLYDVDPSQVSQLRLLMDKINDRVSELEQQREDLETTLVELEEMRQQCLCQIETRRQMESKQG
jgi:DNA-binding transcriptional MerR regulator